MCIYFLICQILKPYNYQMILVSYNLKNHNIKEQPIRSKKNPSSINLTSLKIKPILPPKKQPTRIKPFHPDPQSLKEVDQDFDRALLSQPGARISILMVKVKVKFPLTHMC